MLEGVKILGWGIYQGVTGIVVDPANGLYEAGIRGQSAA